MPAADGYVRLDLLIAAGTESVNIKLMGGSLLLHINPWENLWSAAHKVNPDIIAYQNSERNDQLFQGVSLAASQQIATIDELKTLILYPNVTRQSAEGLFWVLWAQW